MKNTFTSVTGIFAVLISVLPAFVGEAVEPIKTVEIGKNREFRVNGKPFFPLMLWLP